MTPHYTPEQIDREINLAKKYCTYDPPDKTGDRHTENRRALVAIVEQLRERITALEGETDKLRERHAQCERQTDYFDNLRHKAEAECEQLRAENARLRQELFDATRPRLIGPGGAPGREPRQ